MSSAYLPSGWDQPADLHWDGKYGKTGHVGVKDSFTEDSAQSSHGSRVNRIRDSLNSRDGGDGGDDGGEIGYHKNAGIGGAGGMGGMGGKIGSPSQRIRGRGKGIYDDEVFMLDRTLQSDRLGAWMFLMFAPPLLILLHTYRCAVEVKCLFRYCRLLRHFSLVPLLAPPCLSCPNYR